MSEKAYLLGRWDLSSIELKRHAFLLTIGRAISGQPEELSKTGVCRGGRMELRQEQVVESNDFLSANSLVTTFCTYPEPTRYWRTTRPRAVRRPARGTRRRSAAGRLAGLRSGAGRRAWAMLTIDKIGYQ